MLLKAARGVGHHWLIAEVYSCCLWSFAIKFYRCRCEQAATGQTEFPHLHFNNCLKYSSICTSRTLQVELCPGLWVLSDIEVYQTRCWGCFSRSCLEFDLRILVKQMSCSVSSITRVPQKWVIYWIHSSLAWSHELKGEMDFHNLEWA